MKILIFVYFLSFLSFATTQFSSCVWDYEETGPWCNGENNNCDGENQSPIAINKTRSLFSPSHWTPLITFYHFLNVSLSTTTSNVLLVEDNPQNKMIGGPIRNELFLKQIVVHSPVRLLFIFFRVNLRFKLN